MGGVFGVRDGYFGHGRGETEFLFGFQPVLSITGLHWLWAFGLASGVWLRFFSVRVGFIGWGWLVCLGVMCASVRFLC